MPPHQKRAVVSNRRQEVQSEGLDIPFQSQPGKPKSRDLQARPRLQDVAEIGSLGDSLTLWVVFPCLNLVTRPWPGLPSKEYYSLFVREEQSVTAFGGGGAPQTSSF